MELVARVRELIEGPAQRALDTGESQAVDVTDVFFGEDVDVEHLAIAQRAIDATTRGTAGSGYVAAYPKDNGMGLAAVLRGVE